MSVVRAIAVGVVVLAVVVLLAVTMVKRPPWRASEPVRSPERCRGRVVIVRPTRGEPMECICDAGALTGCFSPGP
jgi:hypothetical protein